MHLTLNFLKVSRSISRASLNKLIYFHRIDEMVHMLQLASPKLIVCNYDIAHTVQNALQSIETVVPIYAFDGEDNQIRSIDELLVETHCEEEFK